MIRELLVRSQFEFRVPLVKQVYYSLERHVGHLFFRRNPPEFADARLLNLGAGPLKYDGWVNADDYAFKRLLRQGEFRPDWQLDITKPWRCRNDFWDGIFSQHVLEHVTYSEACLVLGECHRTLKPGGWLRVSVPCIKNYVDFYEGRNTDPFFDQFPERALAISFLTQMHMHKSAWDGKLMTRVLEETGYCNVREVGFGQGTDVRLIKDQDIKAPESLYVEAQKPEPQ